VNTYETIIRDYERAVSRERARRTENLVAAFIAETGLAPSRVRLVIRQWSDGARTTVERRTATDVTLVEALRDFWRSLSPGWRSRLWDRSGAFRLESPASAAKTVLIEEWGGMTHRFVYKEFGEPQVTEEAA
jgi:hypothetical protein